MYKQPFSHLQQQVQAGGQGSPVAWPNSQGQTHFKFSSKQLKLTTLHLTWDFEHFSFCFKSPDPWVDFRSLRPIKRTDSLLVSFTVIFYCVVFENVSFELSGKIQQIWLTCNLMVLLIIDILAFTPIEFLSQQRRTKPSWAPLSTVRSTIKHCL